MNIVPTTDPNRPDLSLSLLTLAFAGLAWLASSCTGAVPPPGVELETGIVFGKGGTRELTLDLTRPKQHQTNMPAVVFIHGGGWVGGDKASFHPFMFHLSQGGVVCVTAAYRLAPHDRFPAQLEDVKCAVRWLRANAEKYGVDPARIAAFGGSAGAHLAALLGATTGQPQWEGQGGHAEHSSAVAAVVGLAGPYDLALAHRDSSRQNPREGAAVRGMLEAFLGGTPQKVPKQYRDASPVSHVKHDTPPMMLVHGTADTLVPIAQSEVFAETLRAAGVEVELLHLEGGTHSDFGKDPEKALAKVAAYVRKRLGLE
jgi:acetyl esterase/lipase